MSLGDPVSLHLMELTKPAVIILVSSQKEK